MTNGETKKSFKDTLNLPTTDFSIRANAAIKEPELLARWQKDALYKKACECNKNKEKFSLHDGPPFANGHMHMGHALNRTLKDMVCKIKRMSGYQVVTVPGWDCHGLPIELKVEKELGKEKDLSAVGRVAFKKKCRAYAQQWIDIQREEIKRLGVISDWEHPYITMSPAYEAAIIKSFATFFEKGHIERQGKTVPWCASCQTVLAIAEIEHQDRTDPSCYILFPFDEVYSRTLFPKYAHKNIHLLVWTTTPWTIPLNRAVILHPTANYVLLQGREENQAFVVGAERADSVCALLGLEKKVLDTVLSKHFVDSKVNHPYIANLVVPIILDDMVTLEDGTACVHCAPGCGPEDYMLGVRNGLEIFSPLSVDGKYTKGIQPIELEGKSIGEGQKWSLQAMEVAGKLLHKEFIKHAYPHCWRCHNPLMFRATEQWFCNLRKNNLIDRALAITQELQFIPEWGRSRLAASMSSRAEWCLSRQREWGVPIVALLCKKCDVPYLNKKFIHAVADHVAQEGVEFWDRITVEELAAQKILPQDFACPECGTNDVQNFRKEMDILDVWFESGVSHTAVQEVNAELTIPADMYLEGSDQHRGWFQSSLLSSVIMYDKTCTKSFLTHAYVLDAQAQKMSKSKGNVISPESIIQNQSADILRLWVASSDFEGDIVVSDQVLQNVAEVYRKIRNTCRFMISNLYDFDYTKDAVPFEKLPLLDQQALATLQKVIEDVKVAYNQYWFTQVYHAINRYCTNDLSAFYLDVLKDRLYTEKADGHLRRSAQTVLYQILDCLTRMMAPVLSFLAEEVSDAYQKDKQKSIHLQRFPDTIDIWALAKRAHKPDYMSGAQYGVIAESGNAATFSARMIGWWNILEQIRPEILKAIEGLRATGSVKHSLEVKVKIHLDGTHELAQGLQAFVDYVKNTEDVTRFFKDFVIVSQWEFVETSEGLEKTALPWLSVGVQHADGIKCPRCWQWEVIDHLDGLCKRCQAVVEK